MRGEDFFFFFHILRLCVSNPWGYDRLRGEVDNYGNDIGVVR